MAKIIYALSGQGRGHTSRVLAISEMLRQRGHEVVYCCGGTAYDILTAQGEPVVYVPALRQLLCGNEVQHLATIRANWPAVVQRGRIVQRLADTFAALHADLLITDFEAFSPRAAQRIGLPVLSFNHQEVVTETEYTLPGAYRLSAWLTKTAIRFIAPRNPAHRLLTSFFLPPLKRPAHTSLVPPIIRPAVQRLRPSRGEHVLVYYNQASGTERVLDALRQTAASFVVYNFPASVDQAQYPNLTFKAPSLEGFLDDLATSRAVLCTAGFTLMSEALYLGKPLLVVPNRGIFEQTLNALFLEREGLGEAVLERPLTAADVQRFLARCERSGFPPLHRACGNEEALACIEALLERGRPTPQLPLRRPVVSLDPAPLPGSK